AAGRRADVGADLPIAADSVLAQRMGQLHSAAADPGMLELLDLQLVVLGDRGTGLVNMLTIDEDAPRHDERLRLRARVDETAFHECEVEPLLHRAAALENAATFTNSRTRFAIPSACRSYCVRSTSCAPWCTYSSGMPMRWNCTFARPSSSQRSITAEPKPPASEPSSTVMTFVPGLQKRRISSSSSGLMKRPFTTATSMPSAASISAACTAGHTSLPIAKIA